MLFLHRRGLRGGLTGTLAVLAALFAILAPQLAMAQGGFKTKAKAALLLDADTGAVYFQHNADQLMPPASISKLVTAAVVFRALKEGRIKLTDEFRMSEHAWRTGGAPSRTSSMFVPINTTATVDDLLKGLIIQSGNDAAICLAEGLSGSEAQFAKSMAEEAKRIGLSKSTFANPSGLYHPDQQMTAREIALLARYLIREYPEYYPIFSQRLFEYSKFKFFNRNPLLALDIGADGLKTGFVRESGYNLVGSAVQGGKRLIVVVMGLATEAERTSEARRLLDWGYRSFAPFTLFEAGETVGSARVWGGESLFVPLTGNGAVRVILPRVPENPRLKAEIVYNGPLKPPVRQGDKVAVLRVITQNNSVNEVPLYAAADVEEGGLVRRGLDSLAYLALGLIPSLKAED